MASRTLTVSIVGDASALSRGFKKATADTEKSMGHLQSSIKKHNTGITKSLVGAAAGFASVAGAISTLKSSVSTVEALAKGTAMLTRTTGIDSKEASEWVTLARVRGVEAKQLNMGFVALARNIKAASLGTKASVAAFKELGISQAEIKRGDASEIIRDVSDAFARMPDGANKAALAQRLFARQAGTLLPLLNKGSGELNKQLGIVDKYGASLDKHGVKQAMAAVSAQRELSIAWQGAQIILATKVLPFITKAAERLGTFVKQMRDGTGAGGRFAKRLGDIADAVRPVVKFFRDHPKLIAAAVAAWGLYKAAVIATVVAGRAQAFRKMFTGGGPMARAEGVKTGAAYSTSFAGAGAAGVRTASGKGGRLRGAFSAAGRGLGGAMGLAAAAMFGVELARGVESTLKDALPGGDRSKPNRPTGTPGAGWNLFDFIKSKVGDGAGKAAEGVVGNLQLPSGGAFGGDLKGARPEMRPFAALGSSFGLGVSSGRRPGAITSSGNPSWHSTGEAIDESGPPAGMMKYFKTLRSRFGSRLAELIYTPGGVGIKDGRPFQYTGQVARDHFNHVHVAFDSGKPGLGDGLGRFQATSYGPPWDAMNGTGVTATGVNLKNAPKRYGVAVDPRVIPLGSKIKISPNPFGYSGLFEAFDTGGAIKGKHIDFYDWRGRGKQLAWGSRNVTISTASASRRRRGGSISLDSAIANVVGGTPPRGGGIPASAGGSGGTDYGTGGYDQGIANVGVDKALAQAHDSLPAMIRALGVELRLKTRRLKRVNRVLKGRISRERRGRLTDEKATLIGEIADIRGLLKEYKADAAGGATTITDAEKLTAGVAEPGDGPTATDFANAAIAEASLTPGLVDDIRETAGLLGVTQGELDAARASGDPRRISAAIDAWKSVRDSLDALRNTITDSQQRLIDELAGLTDEVKRQTDFAQQVKKAGDREVGLALVDFVSGQIVGRSLQGRRQTAGNGTVAFTP